MNLSKAEKVSLILSVLGDNWLTYAAMRKKMNNKMSVGGISKTIWDNEENIQDKIEWEEEVYGDEEWQIRMKFKLKR